jgi:hypothetical protein
MTNQSTTNNQWHNLMDLCKKQGWAPASKNDLFALVSDFREALAGEG